MSTAQTAVRGPPDACTPQRKAACGRSLGAQTSPSRGMCNLRPPHPCFRGTFKRVATGLAPSARDGVVTARAEAGSGPCVLGNGIRFFQPNSPG